MNQAPADLPAAHVEAQSNGAPSLGDRVRSLRLGSRAADKRKPRGAVIPWGLSVILLFTTLAFAYRTYRVAPPGGEPPAEPVPTASTSVPAAASAVASSGEVALESKGYI